MSKRRFTLLPYLLILPTIAFVGLFTVWPTLLVTYQSFFRQRLNVARFRTPEFVGLENYISLFSDPYFLDVMRNTLFYIVFTVTIGMVIGLVFALLANRQVRGSALARLLFFHPMVLPMVSAATIWLFFFTPDYGIVNSTFRMFGYRGPENWTGNPNLALAAVMMVAIWKNAGYYMLFYLAGLQNIPRHVKEAAALDGASEWDTFWQITLPLLRRTTLFVSTIAVIDAFRMVDHIFVLTRGGPSRASTILLFALWQERFENQNVGIAAALAVVFILFLLFFTVTNFASGEQKDEAPA